MSKLQTYVLKEVLKSFLPAFAALLAVMMLGFGVQLLQEGLDIVRLHGLPFYMAVYCAAWVLPSALLTSVIMVFGRLSADKEILAMQVEGMHLWHIVYPVCALAVLLSLLGGYLHFEAAPKARHRIESLQSQAIIQVFRDRILYSAGRRFYVAPYMVSYESYDDGLLKEVKIVEYERERGLSSITYAATGRLEQNLQRPNVLEIVLSDCLRIDQHSSYSTARTITPLLQVGSPPEERREDIRHMNQRMMRERAAELRKEIQGEIYQNPGAKEEQINDAIRPLRSERDSLRAALARLRGRIEGFESDLRNDIRVIEDRRERLRRHNSDLEQLREREAAYVRERRELMDGESEEEERLEKITDIDGELAGVRENIADLQERIEATNKEIADLNESMASKNSGIERLNEEGAQLQGKIDEVSAELREMVSSRRDVAMQEELREIRIRMQRRLTLAFAALAFTVLGIPLGLLSHRRSTMLAFGAGFFVMLAVFYPFMVWGQIMAETGLMPVVPAMWMGNAVTALLGSLMLFALFRY